MIIKKSGGRWQLSLLASVVISVPFFSTQLMPGNKNISLIRNQNIRRNATHGIAIINLRYNDILSNVFKVAQRRAGTAEVNTGGRNPCGWDQQYERGLEFSGLYARITTGPVAALRLRWHGSPSMYQRVWRQYVDAGNGRAALACQRQHAWAGA